MEALYQLSYSPNESLNLAVPSGAPKPTVERCDRLPWSRGGLG